MILVCHMISQDHVIKVHPPKKFGGHGRCGSGDIMFSVAEEEDSRCSLFKRPLLLISERHGLKGHDISY